MRAEKQYLLDEVKEKIEKSNGFIALSYKDFTSARAREFRDKLAEAGAEFEVVRKRVFVKAAADLGFQFHIEKLQGHVGIIFTSGDVGPVAKGTLAYSQDNGDLLAVLGGQIEGEVYSSEDMIAFATLPSLPELRSLLLGLFEAPMAQSAQVVQAALTGVLYCLEEKAQKS